MLNLSSAQKSDLRIKTIQNKCISKIPMKCCPMTFLHLHQCLSHINNIHIVVFFFHLTFAFCCLHRFYHLNLFVFLHVSVLLFYFQEQLIYKYSSSFSNINHMCANQRDKKFIRFLRNF